ncbi:phytoene/squalene synthase family protein [Piscinibacter defluvii]|uniref:phytoene/squalene synthase family protein n=1 Tax=Piscinibacter defluvii TaxID=1796922 RepID=UPI000FDE7762|nr:phytoene/squalene synthase family protein [Piscinibacter defluvii]
MPTNWSEAAGVAEVDLAACRAQLANGSRTFLAASLLLPRAVRGPACALYAFCRLADDAVDGGDDPHAAAQMLRGRLDRLYRGDAWPVPADRALAAVVARFGIPQALPAALIDGFEWDAAGRRYDTLAELEDYAARVAGTVGAMMSLLMGTRDAAALARACDLGVAMQLSNIARDVGEDALAGRLYLPRRWLQEAGIDPEAWLAAPRFDERLAGVLERLLAHADMLYARAGAGVARLPLACRPSINAARFLYAAIGHEVARRGYDSVSTRAVVPRRRKLAGLARALVTWWPDPEAAREPPLAATRYLVDAAADRHAPPRGLAEKALWVLDLFERLERRDRLQRAA